MISFLSKSKEKVQSHDSLLQVKYKYPLAHKHYNRYYQILNENSNCDLFLSLMTQDTYGWEYFPAFLAFFIHNDIAPINDYDIILNCFAILNDRLSAVQN